MATLAALLLPYMRTERRTESAMIPCVHAFESYDTNYIAKRMTRSHSIGTPYLVTFRPSENMFGPVGKAIYIGGLDNTYLNPAIAL